MIFNFKVNPVNVVKFYQAKYETSKTKWKVGGNFDGRLIMVILVSMSKFDLGDNVIWCW